MQELGKQSVLILTILLSSIVSTNALHSVCYYRCVVNDAGVLVTPTTIDPTLCTHYVYAYALLNRTTFEIISNNPKNDVTNGGYLNFTGLRANNTQAKFLLALGGRTDSADSSGKYSNLVKSTANINTMVNSTLAFLQKYQFDGLSLDWLVPNSTDDFIGYSNLIVALKTAFTQKGLLLSSSVSALQGNIDGYNISILNRYLDLVYLTTFDYYTSYASPTSARHPSPLYSPPNDPPAANMTVDFSVQYWLTKGLSPRLINMGIPLHSYVWGMNRTRPSYLQPVAAAEGGSAVTNLLLCLAVKQGTIKAVKADMRLNISSYFINTDNVSSNLTILGGFDSADMVASKVVYAITNGLGGVVLSDINEEDISNSCGGGFFPTVNLVSTLTNSLRSWSIQTSMTPYPTTETTPLNSTSLNTTLPTTYTTTLPPGKCDCSCPVADPTSCKRFNLLLDGVAYKTSCPTGKYFNSASMKCDDDPTNTKCPSTELKKSEILSYNAVKYDWKVAY